MSSSQKFERGALVIIAGKGDYDGKPRPAVILQQARHDLNSVLVCPLTSTPIDLDVPYRIRIEPSRRNGLKVVSWAMADKISSIRKERVDRRFGIADQNQLQLIIEGLHVLID